VEILGVSLDAILFVLLLVGWFVTMRFILPRLGVST
jgi:p-aminobenzoyl-glutamate transporter AbgT